MMGSDRKESSKHIHSYKVNNNLTSCMFASFIHSTFTCSKEFPLVYYVLWILGPGFKRSSEDSFCPDLPKNILQYVV
jgi:hypothetical protein